MANVILTAYDKNGNAVESKEVDSADVPRLKINAEKRGYTVEIKAKLSPQETAGLASQIQQETSPRSAAVGGFLQGLSLGTEDILEKDRESLRMRQKADQPVAYELSKAVGSLLPGAVAGLGGAALGGALGAGVGAAGGPIGALLGAAAGGGLASAAEEYFSQPEAEKDIGEAAKTGGISAGLGVIPGLAIGRKLGKAGKAVKEIVEVPSVQQAPTKLLERAQTELMQAVEKNKKLVKELLTDPSIAAESAATPGDFSAAIAKRTAKHKELLSRSAEYKELSKKIDDIRKTIGVEKTKELLLTAGVPVGAVDVLIGSALGSLETNDPAQIAELNRQAAARAFEEAQRKKTEQLLGDIEAETAVRSGVTERNVERMQQLAPKKKKK